jgi:hypothetical protein
MARKLSKLAVLATAIAIAAACGGSTTTGGNTDGGSAPPAPSAANLYEDFSGTISGAKWKDGDHGAALVGGKAVLTETASAVPSNVGFNNQLVVKPPSGGQVTTLASDIVLTSASQTGDTIARAQIDLFFQPAANRVIESDAGNKNMLIARIALQPGTTAGTYVAIRQLFECTTPNCSASQGIGTPTGTWTNTGVAITPGTAYTVSISYTAAKVFTFSISGGTIPAGTTATIDAATGTPPFPVDVSAANFNRARLVSALRGGPTGGGDGAVSATFDNVQVGVNFGAAALFDDFGTGTQFDTSKWNFGEETAHVASGALAVTLKQQDFESPRVSMELASASTSAFQADVTVTQYSHVGGGDIRAALQTTLYNDGSSGSGAANVNAPDSQVGDLIASVGMTGTQAVYAVVRCDTVACEQATFLKPYTALGAVTLGTTHTLYVNWDAPTHQVVFKLDGNAPVAFDPVGAGYAVSSAAPRVPLKRLGARAANNSATDTFTTGSSGSIAATFDNVKTN